LTSSANPSVLGHAITLTASVSPSPATGKVTFYDGVAVLETEAVSNGRATLSSTLLASGLRSLRAYYLGDETYAPSTSASFAQTVNTLPQNGILPAVNYVLPGAPNAVAVGDFNGDGKADLAVANYDAAVSVLLGNGDGTFGSPVDYALPGSTPNSVAVADFNGDGITDLAILSSTNGVIVLLGNGDGTFQAPLNTAAGAEPDWLSVADFNGDGKADLAVLDFAGGNLSILLGNGDGSFQPPVNTPIGPEPVFGAAGDFNGDGIPDLAIASDNSQVINVLFGNGDGTFQNPVSSGAVSSAVFILVGDFNGDGKADLVLTGGSAGVSTLLGNGNGTFQAPLTSGGPLALGLLVVGDFNGDGIADLADTVQIFIGNGDGTFQTPISYDTGTEVVWGVAAGDFNGDGRTDLAASGNAAFGFGVSVILGQPEPCLAFTPASIFVDGPGGEYPVTIESVGECSWSVSSSASWIGVTPASGVNVGTVTIAMGANLSGADQNGTASVVVQGEPAQTFPITQRFTATVFADVAAPAYYFDSVNLLSGKGITSGCGTNPLDYCPTAPVTRAEVAILIVRSVYGGDNFTTSQTPYFADVGPTDFGFQWIQKMFELGITTGCGGGDFCPAGSVTRAEAAIFTIRARYGATANFDVSPFGYFVDVPPGSFGYNWIQRMAMDNITTGCGALTYCPDEAATRGDMAIFIMRGCFNQFPPGAAVISGITPSTIGRGQTTTVTVTGTIYFGAGTTILNPIPGLTIGPVDVTSPTTFTVNLTPAANAPAMPDSIWVTSGTVEAVLPNGLVVQ
jgi:hypothetical protein